jgi:hypothetical protein
MQRAVKPKKERKQEIEDPVDRDIELLSKRVMKEISDNETNEKSR